VHRARAQRLQLVVVFGALELERVDPGRAFVRIEPALGQKHAHCVDAVLEPMHRGGLQVLQSEALEHSSRLLPVPSSLAWASCGTMWPA
jgi:hypothetical protein